MDPELSVVVPSVNGLSDLVDCLTALERESRSTALDGSAGDGLDGGGDISETRGVCQKL